jgi:hypothetical protein
VTELVIHQEEWERGLTMNSLIDEMTVNQAAMRRRFNLVSLTDAEKSRLANLKIPRRILVMTEEWCSDCLMNLPILARLAEAVAATEIRFFIRKDWPEFRAYFNERDIYSLPTVQIMDEAFTPLGVWVERPQAAHDWLAQWKADHPEVERTRRRADLTSDQKREMLREASERLLVEMERCYNQELQSETVREVTEVLEALEKDPQGV